MDLSIRKMRLSPCSNEEHRNCACFAGIPSEPMNMKIRRTLLTVSNVLICVATLSRGSDHPALNEPDRFAWETLVEISKPHANDARAGWETWITARDTFANPDK